ncbi:MAG: hypothetical protein IKN12_11220 [Selenomonadaceae bacterium]|nr:hypothetical protein [Selenomonadaceae bacterium]
MNWKKIFSRKYSGVALVGTTAAIVAWMLLSYGIFTVQSSQFQMFVSSRDSVNAKKLAEVDAELLKLVNYDDIQNSSALGELNLHLGRSDMKTVALDSGRWQDEIIISNEMGGSGDSQYGNFRVATVNVYKEDETEPRFSMQVPILKSGQTYSKKDFDDFIEELKKKDKELEEKDKQLEAKDRQLEAKDRQLEAKDSELSSKISSLRSELQSAVDSNQCQCASDIPGSGS